jgi:hypothetical protein
MDSIKQLLTKTNRRKLANRLFYLALMIELILMIVEKSELPFSYESYIFRVTFVITFLAVIITDHENREWALIVTAWVFTFACYRLSGKNDLMRFATFVMAAKNINLGKTMKVMFWTSFAGFAAIALLALTGIYGHISVVADYGREAGEELRYAVGFGHPNTLWGCVYALMLLWLWVYGSKAKLWHFLVITVANYGLYKITVSRTSLAIGMITILLAVMVRYIPRISTRKFAYIMTGLVTPCLCVAFSVWAAIVSYIPRYVWRSNWDARLTRFDELLNNRIHNLYRANERHAGAFVSWKLFSDRESVEYFDMGWVRLFYWYGIIPAAVICVLLIVFIWLCYKRKDGWTLMVLLSASIYTVIEATFISRYFGRFILLPVIGVYFGSLFERKMLTDVEKK